MKKLIVSAVALSTLLWVGCGSDDDDPPPPDTTVTVTADTMTAPAMPLVYNDPVWDDVTATSISLLDPPMPVGPLKTPMGPDKSLNAPSSVDLQAIKKGDRLYLRIQWTDASLSMQREQWTYSLEQGFSFTINDIGEDQVIALFEGGPGFGWDLWNWRVLTTGIQNKAEDGTWLDGDTVWDAGLNRIATKNATNDIHTPPWFHSSRWEFTGDVLYRSEKISRDSAMTGGTDSWVIGQTVPGWWIDDEVDWTTITESRWDIEAGYNYDSTADRYTLVMARDMAAHEDDIDMSVLSRIKTRIGILDNSLDFGRGSSQRAFSADFWLALP